MHVCYVWKREKLAKLCLPRLWEFTRPPSSPPLMCVWTVHWIQDIPTEPTEVCSTRCALPLSHWHPHLHLSSNIHNRLVTCLHQTTNALWTLPWRRDPPESGDVCFDAKGIIGKFVKGLDQRLALPFVGYSYYKKTRFDYYISKILQQEEITPKDFYIKEMQEVSNEGGFRQASIDCSNFISKDDAVEFSLSRGSFATIVLREIMKPLHPLSVGFWW